ncbi:MAG: hypothetical protein AB1896_12835, partial [Thermodesulfobacteriota bacterium]
HPIPIEEFEYKVRRIITDYVAPPKNEYKLKQALWWMDRFRRDFVDLVRIGDHHDLFKAFEIENIIQCARLSALASLERRESRWGLWHYRSDFPDQDDRYLKHIVLRQGDGPEDVVVTHRDIVRMQGA